jgi:hypothetical protein
VAVDQPDHDLQVGAGGVLRGVVLDLAPGLEGEQLRVVGPQAGAQADRGLGEPADLAAAADQRGAAALVRSGHKLGDRLGVGAAQHRPGAGQRGHPGGDLLEAAQPERRAEQAEPLICLTSDRGAEAERLRQRQPRIGGEARHGVDRAAPAVDRLAAVADQDALGVALPLDHVGDHGVGVLGLVQQHEVALQPRPGELPQLEVVVVGEPQVSVRVGQVGPGLPCQRHHRLLECREGLGLVQAGDGGDMLRPELGGGRVAEPGDGVHGEPGSLGRGEDLAAVQPDRPGDGELAGDLAGGHAGGAQPVSKLAADRAECQGVRGGAGHVGGKERLASSAMARL